MGEKINLWDYVRITIPYPVQVKRYDNTETKDLQGAIGRVTRIFYTASGIENYLVEFKEWGFGWAFPRSHLALHERANNQETDAQQSTAQAPEEPSHVSGHEAIEMLKNAVEGRLVQAQDMVGFMKDHGFLHEMEYHQMLCDMLHGFLAMIRDVRRTVRDENRRRTHRTAGDNED